MFDKKFSVILPSFKEADNLQELLPRLIQVADDCLESYEILIVDANVSLDSTAEICNHLSVRYLNRQPGNCYGDAVRTGIHYAKGEFLIFMDADGSHPPEFLTEMVEYAEGYDLVIASRYIKNGSTENGFLEQQMSKMLNVVYTRLLKINCRDISNSFRIYRSEQVKLIKLKCDNFNILQEILFGLVAQFPQFTIKEVPFKFKKRVHGRSKRNLVVFILSYFMTLMRLVLLRFKTKNVDF